MQKQQYKKIAPSITIKIMGGLGNQMFEYAMLRSMSLEYNSKAIADLSGITNKTHNVYSLDNFNISNEVDFIPKRKSIRNTINYLLYGFYYVFIQKRKCNLKYIKFQNKIIRNFGMCCIPDGYIDIGKVKCKNKYFFGYFQSNNFFKKYEKIIREELQVKTPPKKSNAKLLEEISNCESVCLHIRRGDYVGTNHQVCTIEYYLKAINEMNKIVKKPIYYIFSDDIKWVRENIVFDKKDNIVYIDKKNDNYEELRLMYTCKNFIISNSSFSWWASFLSKNEKKNIISPSVWTRNENIPCDMIDKNWIKIDV